MARLTASQISLMKQFFAQIGAVDSSWILGDIPVDQIGGAGSWFTDSFDARLAVKAPSIVTTQATAAETAAAAANAALLARVTNSGQVSTSALQVITAVSPAFDDVTDLTTPINLTAATTIVFCASICAVVAAPASALVYLDVDGTAETVYGNASTDVGTLTQHVVQTWRLALGAGAHTVKVKARIAGAGSVTLAKERSTLTWWQV